MLVGAVSTGSACGCAGVSPPSVPLPSCVGSASPVTGSFVTSSFELPPLLPNTSTSTTMSSTRITPPAMTKGSFDCTTLEAFGPA